MYAIRIENFSYGFYIEKSVVPNSNLTNTLNIYILKASLFNHFSITKKLVNVTLNTNL